MTAKRISRVAVAPLPTRSSLEREYGRDAVCVLAEQPEGLPKGVVKVDFYYAPGGTCFYPVLCRDK
jgi:hypothetical protein